MKKAIRIIKGSREVYEWGEEGEGEHQFSGDAEWLHGEFPGIDELNVSLCKYGFDPLKEWYSYEANGWQWYTTSQLEDGHGMPSSDGKYSAQYCIAVERLTIEPYIIGGDDGN